MGHTILVAEHEANMRAILCRLLEDAGYTVDEAADGVEALAYLETHTPDVLVLDLRMPLLSGDALLERVRQMPALQNMRVLVLTAFLGEKEMIARLHVDRFLLAPIAVPEFLQTVEELLNDA